MDIVHHLLGDLPGDLILHLVQLPAHHLATLVKHLGNLVGHMATEWESVTTNQSTNLHREAPFNEALPYLGIA